jgi:hypothetical protein
MENTRNLFCQLTLLPFMTVVCPGADKRYTAFCGQGDDYSTGDWQEQFVDTENHVVRRIQAELGAETRKRNGS